LVAAGPDDQAEVAGLLDSVSLPVVVVAEVAVVLVARRADGSLLGCAALEVHATTGLLRSVAVAPSARRHGVARALVDEMESRARAIGLVELVLLTLDAVPVFTALGYQVVPRSTLSGPVLGSWEFRHHACDAAQVMRRDLA
jgi:amino-acid N-acetyltransferase